jgi:hypothetical protein
MNAPFKPETAAIPDILLSGQAVGLIINALNNGIIFAKVADGSMRPFIDPTPISNIIQAAINAALDPDKAE